MPELARSLAAVAEGGADAFYRGDLGRALSEHVRAYGGWITPEDLAAHESTWDEPISVEYRGVRLWECPPNGQGIIAAIAARLADGFDLGGMDEADRTHLAVECMRRGRADALRYVGDPRCVEVPTETLLSDAYTERRRAEINPKRASRHAGPGRIGTDTVYVSVVDGAGNACSCIGSLFMGFGTSLVVPGTGISLQNRGAGFSLDETHPNALAPGRRPFHTIIPALTTTPDGALESCYGVMGGPMQPQGHLQVLINRFDRGLEPQAALDRPRWRLDDEGHLFVEVGTDERVVAELERRGHEVTVVEGPERSQFGSGQIIRRDPENGVLTGASDPRADGAAVGY